MPLSATTLLNRLLSRGKFRHLHLFVKVADLRTVKRAAEAVGITQPSATQVVADLERLLGSALFFRHSQGMSLTATGSALLPLARKALGIVEETATQAAALAHGSHSVVRVAAISAAIGGGLGEAMPGFARAHPGVSVHLQEADARRQAVLLADGEIDCAVCRAPPVLPSGWSFTPLWPDRFAIVARPTHPLAKRRRVGMDDLLRAMWIVMPTSIAARTAFDKLFEQAPAPPRTYSVVTASSTMLWTLLAKEPLLALTPISVARHLLAVGQLTEIPWSGFAPFGAIGVLTPMDVQSPALAHFVDSLKQCAEADNVAGA